MRKIITFTTCLLSTLCLIGCKSSDGIDWKSYSNDYNELIKREQFNDTYPLDITGEASKAGDVYKLVITFDNAKELIENVKIIVCSQSEIDEYIHGQSTKAPFLGYNEKISLGPSKDSLTNTYAGLNLAFGSTEANPKMKISIKGKNISYYMLFNNFVMEE